MQRVTYHITALIVCAIPMAFSPLAFSEGNLDSLCQAKVEDIQTQRHAAEQNGNAHRARGLTRALEEVQKNCTNNKVLEDAEQDVRNSMAEVQQRQADLEEAQQEGDTDDIRNRSEKLDEAVAEMEVDQQNLESLLKQQ